MQPIILNLLASTWWIILVRGLAFLAFGILAFTTPLITISFLVSYWAIFLLIDGGVCLVSTLKNSEKPGRSLTKGSGILSLGLGLLLLLNPQFMAQSILMLLGWVLILKGFVLGTISLNLGFRNRGAGLLCLTAILSFILGYWIISHPAAAAATMLRLFSIFAIVIGFVISSFALQLRKHFKNKDSNEPTMQSKKQRFDDEPFIDV